MRPAASRMSSMRTRQSLGGTDGLGENAVAQLALHGVAHDQIDAAAEDLLEAVLDAEEVEQAHGAVEVDQEIHIAVRSGLPSRDRTEQVERAHAEPSELRSRSGKALDHRVARHYSTLRPSS